MGVASATAVAAEKPGASAGQIMVMLKLPPAHFRAGANYNAGYGDDAARGARRRTAERVARAHGLTIVDSWPMPTLGVECFIMAVPDGGKPAQVAELVGKDDGVEWSEPVVDYAVQAQKNDQAD